jgi:hypothetical protein
MHHLVLYACYNLADEWLDMVGKEPNCNWKTFSNPCNGFVTECKYLHLLRSLLPRAVHFSSTYLQLLATISLTHP